MLKLASAGNRIGYLLLLASALLILIVSHSALAQMTAFTYQGKLNDSGNLAGGPHDFQFKLFDTVAVGTGAQQGSVLNISNVPVTAGIFSVQLDFGVSVFPGADRYLEISVRPAGGGAFTMLAPRQAVTSTPYALRSTTAGTADTAMNATQLGGLTASGFIQNTTSQQAGTSFNIGGTGTANILNAATQFNLGGNRILSNAGGENLFAGVSAGASNTTGIHNTFFGASAGSSNTNGIANSFFGSSSGQANTGGSSNSFFGVQAGFANTTGGNNSFVGASAGNANTTGNSNSFFGSVAGFSNTTGNSNSFFGVSAGNSNTTGANNSFFGRDAGRFGATGANNSFFGAFAGQQNTTGNDNAFFGKNAGNQNTTGFQNTIIGVAAGLFNTDGSNNLFVGNTAGFENTTGNNNSFVGTSAGTQNTTGLNNSFFGVGAGGANTTGNNNTLIGSFANVGASNRSFATAIGARSVARIDDTIVLGKEAGTYDGVLRNADQVVVPGRAYVLGILNASGQFGVNIFGGTLGASNAAYLNFTDSNLGPLGYVGDGSSQDENIYLSSYLHDVIIYTQVGAALTTTSTGKVIVPAGQASGFSPAFEVAPSQLGGSVIANNLYVRQFNELPSPAHLCWRASGVGIQALVLTTCTSSLSSVQVKTNIKPFASGLDIVKRLNPVTFKWKADGTNDVGLNAEDLALVEPRLVTRNNKGEIEDVKQDGLQVVFINAIKELEAKITKQQQEIEDLKRHQQEFDSLRKLFCADRPNADSCKPN